MFANRDDAGRRLGAVLARFRDRAPLIVALPRGGVPVGYEVARALDAPLDVLIVRKLGAPGQPELGLGAVAEGGATWLDADRVRDLRVPPAYLEEVTRAELAEMGRRLAVYRGDRPPLNVAGRTVILVDDGLATGVTVRAAVSALRRQAPRAIVLAVPVCAAESARQMRALVDEVVCVEAPERFRAVGLWYDDFAPTSDEEVLALLARPTGPNASRSTEEVRVSVGDATLLGDLDVLPRAVGVVIFAHGSGSSRRSPRNRMVAEALRRDGHATLLLDLLTEDEGRVDERTRHLRFDLPLLAGRLRAATEWVGRHPPTSALRVGYFGASTGAGAALIAAAERPDLVAAVVSRGGRPDLADSWLPRVRAPTLLIVGGADEAVLALNRAAMGEMNAPARLEVVPGATHLFEEPGALERVASLAGCWFSTHLVGGPR